MLKIITVLRLASFLFALILNSINAQDFSHLMLTSQLEELGKADLLAFKLRDNEERGLDCLEVFQARVSKDGRCLGVSHSLKNGVFSVHLSESIDLQKWKHVVELDQHGSQATIHETDDGAFLLAYEKDAPNSCWIRLRFYPDMTALRAGKYTREIDLHRTLAPTAEGTPSFEKVEIKNGDLFNSEILLRFHYYKRAQVDQLASGSLTNFEIWKTTPSRPLSQAFIKLGADGNIGDRSKFIWKDQIFYLQEAQGTRRDWETWGLFLCDAEGRPLQKLKPRTPGKSTAFSNAAVSRIVNGEGQELLVMTAFIHSKGSSPKESGQMLMAIEIP